VRLQRAGRGSWSFEEKMNGWANDEGLVQKLIDDPESLIRPSEAIRLNS
jgi:hypothetical protein